MPLPPRWRTLRSILGFVAANNILENAVECFLQAIAAPVNLPVQ
jgi:hypothetical protein